MSLIVFVSRARALKCPKEKFQSYHVERQMLNPQDGQMQGPIQAIAAPRIQEVRCSEAGC